MNDQRLDCLVIGHNEIPLAVYEEKLRTYGEDSEGYRDLKFSMLDVDGTKYSFLDMMNHVLGPEVEAREFFKSGEIPHLATVYLVTYLRRRGFHADYVNLFRAERDKLRHLTGGSPLAVAITTTLYVLNFPAIEISELVREYHPNTRIIIGGPLIANHARNYQGDQLRIALADTGADIFVIEGQGETTLTQVLEALKRDGDLSGVPNIAYLEDGELKVNPVLPETNAMNENYIDWTGFPERNLGPTIQTRTARSCAFKCAFCNYPTRAGKLSLANLATIEKELDSMHRLGNVKNVVFIDDTFNVPLPRFKDICRLMIEKKYGFEWYSYFRCSNSDEEAFDLMARSGCAGVFLGIESGSPTILENMDKHANTEQYSRGIAALRERGIISFASFIIGFPGESDETVQETIDFIRDNRPDFYRAQMWYNEMGTPIHKRVDEFGITGEGFVWEHNTMDSMEAMEHIERMFLEIRESIWLPQWSFDFWIIPYLRGLGIRKEQFKDFMRNAQEMLRLEIATLPAREKQRLQKKPLERMFVDAQRWEVGVPLAV